MNASNILSTYPPPPFDAERGEGCYLYDTDGRCYLDFGTGIAVNSVGHNHPKWVRAVQDQAARLVHCSNLYGIPGQRALADRLVRQAGAGALFFCNSGTEANEALIKLARLHGRRLADGEEGRRYAIVAAENAFHGRTFGGMAATPQEKIQSGFRPMLDGFRFGELNRIESFERLVDENVAAVFLETIQGEGGVYPADPSFLRELRRLCSERGVLLMIDEVQCGIGRTGRFFAYQAADIVPDAVGMAKGLGGGFPIGAVWVAECHRDLFQPGGHGTTFGGSPLAAAAAGAVLDIIEEEKLLESVTRQSGPWHQALHKLAERHPRHIAAVRGEGYMIGLGLHTDARDVAAAARDRGLLAVPAGPDTLRLLPPLIATAGQLEDSVRILGDVFTYLAGDENQTG